MEEGIDDVSRGMARKAAYPACTARMQSLLQEEAASRGWELSLDLFASEVNAVTPLFFSRFAEPAAEAVDALSVLDWTSLYARSAAWGTARWFSRSRPRTS